MNKYNLDVCLPDGIKCVTNTTQAHNSTKYEIVLTAERDLELSEQSVKLGFLHSVNKSVIMTHQLSVSHTALPFAFPAVAALGDGFGICIVADYYKTSIPLRFVNADVNGICLVNEQTQLKKGESLKCTLYFAQINTDSLFDLVGNCAEILLENIPYWRNEFSVQQGQNVQSYFEASLGLVSNLMDKRAIVRDGTGTFNPYGYHEIGAYSESFACLDVAKGMYRFALSNGLKGPTDYIRNQVRHLCDTSAAHPWIADCHNAKGFFHHAWGAIPQDSGVASDIKRDDLFSDYDGHEEGPNLLSTFKYFDRVNLLGEMAILENDGVITEGFLKVLPFVESLRNDDFTQPVTYDLDTHKPVTGNTDGGSGGAEALYALIQFNAYKITGEDYHLEYALSSVDAANKLDYDRMFSMRCAPKPIAIGALVRANVFAYLHTGKTEYLQHARRVAQGIFSFYYLNPHPYAFFSPVGFGYACAQERWEAFREMEESLWLMVPYLEYCNDMSVFRLYALNKQSALAALPINGNPYGNLQRDYESFGGEYIPYEFSTGHIGDNPGLCGGSQSDRRQIKEIYGSGELFLANLMYENFARSYNKFVSVICTNCYNTLPRDNYAFRVFNSSTCDQSAIIDFRTEKGLYILKIGDLCCTLSSEQLAQGVVLTFPVGITSVVLSKISDRLIAVSEQKLAQKVNLTRLSDNIVLSWQNVECDFYIITDKTELGGNVYKVQSNDLQLTVDGELHHVFSVVGISGNCTKVFDSVQITPQKRTFDYKFDFETCADLQCSGFDCVTDGHCLMFYRTSLQTDTGIAQFAFNGSAGSLLELAVGAVNNGTKYTVSLLRNGTETVLATAEFPQNFVFRLDEDGQATIKISAVSSQGLGLSVTQMQVCKLQAVSNSPVLKLKRTENGVKANLLGNYRYAVVAVGDMAHSDVFQILVDGIPAFSSQERQFAKKVDRSNRGVFKVPLKDDSKEIRIVTERPSDKFVKAIRLTQSDGYPILTHYFDKDDEENFYD